MTDQNLLATISLLSRTPVVLDALLRDLPDALTRSTEGPGTWTPFDVVGHLLHGERTDSDAARIRTILEAGDARTFEPFDRFAQQRESEASRSHSCWTSSHASAPGTWTSCARCGCSPPTWSGADIIPRSVR